MLGELGIVPASADWSLYAFNRIAAAELARLGIGSFVLSPESSLENMLALPSSSAELLAYQHTPLFLSATAPCLPEAETDSPVRLSDRRGRTFVTRKIDGLWVTVWDSAFCIADRLAVGKGEGFAGQFRIAHRVVDDAVVIRTQAGDQGVVVREGEAGE